MSMSMLHSVAWSSRPLRCAAWPRRARAGFLTLVELLVAGIILALLFVVGLDQLRRARIITNEQLAMNSVRVITKACHMYYAVNGRYPPNLVALEPWLPSRSYLETTLAQDPVTKQGYTFTFIPQTNGMDFSLLADPVTHGVTGARHFYVDRELRIHATPKNQRATRSDPAVPEATPRTGGVS